LSSTNSGIDKQTNTPSLMDFKTASKSNCSEIIKIIKHNPQCPKLREKENTKTIKWMAFQYIQHKRQIHASENHYLLHVNCQESIYPYTWKFHSNIKETNKLQTINH